MRKIPATMATQHPDNACAPFWKKNGDGFVSTYEEIEECYSAFNDLGCEEYMWDWEGKFVEESVVERLFQDHFDYFQKHPLGKEKFLTFRIPNIWQEKVHGLARAMMCMLTADDAARHLGAHAPPLFEVILPMTKKAEEMVHIQTLFAKLSTFITDLFQHKTTLSGIDVMPLFEGIDDLLQSKKLLDRYVSLLKQKKQKIPDVMRLHIARSDPALNAGLVSAVVAGKIALSEFYRFGKEQNIAVFPAIGVGTLPFRGSLSPERIDEFMREYGGMKTVYVQSAFRYDHPLPLVKSAISTLNKKLQKTTPLLFTKKSDLQETEEICTTFTLPYRRIVEKLAPTINDLAKQVPRRRERKQHIGLFGYSRSIGKKRLPRAIPFTAALYSLGVPPEFIGTGFGLRALEKKGIAIEKYYLNIKNDLSFAGRFVNKKNLALLASKNNVWKLIQEDIASVEKFLGIELGPRESSDSGHASVTEKIYRDWCHKKSLSDDIVAGGKLRKSLG